MENSNVDQARERLKAIGNRLQEITENLHDRSVEELGTGRPVNSNVAEAIRDIEAVRAELESIRVEASGSREDKGLEQERTERAISEVNSEEFDMQG